MITFVAAAAFVLPRTSSAELTAVLGEGSQGSQVTELQQALARFGYLNAAPTGVYGPATKEAVMKFQAASGLYASGAFDRSTRLALVARLGGNTSSAPAAATTPAYSAPATTPLAPLAIGSSGAAVHAVQDILKRLGYLTVEPTGYFGTLTKAAVAAFQAANNLEPVGYVGPRTVTHLAEKALTLVSSTGTNTSTTGGSVASDVNSIRERIEKQMRNRPRLTLSVNDTDVTSGSTVVLQWSGTNVTSCTASGSWTGTQAVKGTKDFTNLSLDQTFILTCTGEGGSITKSVKVAVSNPVTPPVPVPTPAPTVTLSSDLATITRDGKVVLTWATTNATSCIASGGWSGTQTTSGTKSILGILNNTTYTLTCSGAGGTAAKSISVTVISPVPVAVPTLTLTSSAASVVSGGSATLTWAATNATSCTASGSWTGALAASGSKVVSGITVPSTYALTCTGAGGSVAKEVVVTVVSPASAPTLTLTSNVSSVTSGGSATLTWAAVNATSCIASGNWTGTLATSGSKAVTNITAPSTYTLACTGAGGTVSKSVSVGVTSVTQPTPTPSTSPGTYQVYPGCEAPATSYLRTIYIDPVLGNDTTGDGSLAKPYKTLQLFVNGRKTQGGDRVVLLPGDHGSLVVNRYTTSYLVGTTQWIWIDFREGAVMKSMDLKDMNRWLITNGEFTGTGVRFVSFGNGGQMVLADSEMYTTRNTSGWGPTEWLAASSGISTRNAKCVAVLRNKLSNIRAGMTFLSDATNVADSRQKILVEGNEIRNFSADGMRPIGSDITMRGNFMYDQYLGSKDGDANHDDGIQMFALEGFAQDNIVLDKNWIQETTNPNRAYIGGMQGIGHFDGPLTNFKVTNNTIITSVWHGITTAARDSLIANNTVVNYTNNGANSWITVDEGKSSTIVPTNTILRNNIAVTIRTIPVVLSENNFSISDPTSVFRVFDKTTATFDLRPKAGSIIDGKGAGSFPTGSAPTAGATGTNPPTCTLSTSAISIERDTSATLTLASTGATSASINNGVGSIAVNGTVSVTPFDSTGYTATVTGAGGTNTCQVKVLVTSSKPKIPAVNSVGPVIRFSFDNATVFSSVVRDISGNNHIATLTNGATIVAGKSGEALSMNTRKQGAVIGTIPLSDLNITDRATVAMWVNARDLSGSLNYAFVHGRTASSNTVDYSAHFAAGNYGGGPGVVWSDATTTAGAGAPKTAPMALNRWYHLAGTLDGDNSAFYVDGVLVGSGTKANFGLLNQKLLKMGIGFDSSRADYAFQGLIDDFRIYNRALSAGEVASLAAGSFAQGNGGSVAGAVRAYVFTKRLMQGATGAEVIALQELLRKLGHYTYPEITGYYGPATKEAVMKFQAASALEAVGEVGPKTQGLLNATAAAQ